MTLYLALWIPTALSQKAKGADRKKELQGQLTRVQQQIREEQARRQKQVIDTEHKVHSRAMYDYGWTTHAARGGLAESFSGHGVGAGCNSSCASFLSLRWVLRAPLSTPQQPCFPWWLG